MKIQGHDFDQPTVELVAIPRGTNAHTGEKVPDIIFKCAPVLSFDEFETLCPVPIAPQVIKAGGVRESNFEHPEYVSAIGKRAEQRVAYIIIHSLKATEGLEWDVIVPGNPKTWLKYNEEFEKAGFSQTEINRILNGCFAANGLSQSRVDEALANFQLGQQEQRSDTSGLHIAADSSPSGEPANDSE